MKASALITLHDVDLAVEEVRRAVNELGIRALSLCPEPINGKRIHDRYFDPLWAEIEKLGVALCFHPPARPKQEQVANKFFGHPNASIVALALRNPVELIQAVSCFCAGGVLEKFPNLRVAFLEGNCAWLPWLLYRLDERAKLHGPLADVPLSRRPSEYFLRQCFISMDPDEELVTDVIKRIGDETISDHPPITRISTPISPMLWMNFSRSKTSAIAAGGKFFGTIARGYGCTMLATKAGVATSKFVNVLRVTTTGKFHLGSSQRFERIETV